MKQHPTSELPAAGAARPESHDPDPPRVSGVRRMFLERLTGAGDGGNQSGLARGAAVAFLLQGLGAAVTYAMQVLLGRWMGPGEYGTYSFTLAWAALVAVIAGVGLPITVLRFIPAFLSRGDFARARGLLQISVLINCAVGFGIALIGTGATLLASDGNGPDWVLILGLWIAALLTLRTLQQEIVRGFRQIALAYAPGMVIRPLLIIAGGAAYFASDHTLGSVAALTITAAAMVAALLLQGGRFWWKLESAMRRVAPIYETRAWMAVALPLLLIIGFEVILSETDIVMVGAFLGSKSAGVYTAASKTSILVGMVLISANAIAAPMYASLWARDRLDDLAVLARRVAVWVFWPTLLVSIFLALAAKPVLGLFGSQFTAGSSILRVLLVGQLISAGVGSVGYLMTLTGHQREAAHVYGGVAALHLAVNALTIPLLGAIGAAVATSFSISIWSLWLHTLVVRRLGIHPSILGSWQSRQKHA